MDFASLSIQLTRATKSLLAAFDETSERRSRAVVTQDASAETKLDGDNTIRPSGIRPGVTPDHRGSESVGVGSLTPRRFNQ
jgi:hypothetical protein